MKELQFRKVKYSVPFKLLVDESKRISEDVKLMVNMPLRGPYPYTPKLKTKIKMFFNKIFNKGQNK